MTVEAYFSLAKFSRDPVVAMLRKTGLHPHALMVRVNWPLIYAGLRVVDGGDIQPDRARMLGQEVYILGVDDYGWKQAMRDGFDVLDVVDFPGKRKRGLSKKSHTNVRAHRRGRGDVRRHKRRLR